MQRTGSPITTETDIDLTAALLPSGGTRSHHHAIKTAVSETGTLPAPGYKGPPFPAGCRAKQQTGALPGAGCRLWNVPCPKLPPAGGPGKGFGQSTLPFSFGTSAVPPHSKLPTGMSQLGSGPGPRGEPGICSGLKSLYLECWEGPETEPGLDNGRAPPSAFGKLCLREGSSPWADARLCSVQPGQAGPLPEIHPGPQEELGGGGASPSAAISPPKGSTVTRQAESAGPGGGLLASETAAEPWRDSSIAQSAGAEPAMGREGTQDGPCSVSTVHLQRLAVAGSGLAPGTPPEPDTRGREEEAEARRHQGPELGRQPGASSSAGPAGLGRESSEPIAQETAGQAQQPRGLRSAARSAPAKTSVEDAYGRLTKACGLSLLEELRRTFLDAEGSCFVLLDSGLLLGRVEEHPALGLAVLAMRDGRKLATALPSSSLFLYYTLGRQFYVWEQLADCWFRVRDRVSGESMLMKKVPVVSDWRKMLHNFLFLPPHPALLVPYAVLYDRSGSVLYLMEDRDVHVGRPPEGPGLATPHALREVLSFLSFCKRHGVQPGDAGAAAIYTAQGVCFDPSSLSSSEDPYAFRKSLKTCLRPLLAWHQGPVDSLVDSMGQYLEEESLEHSEWLSSLDSGAAPK